jgi:hypothetical protein
MTVPGDTQPNPPTVFVTSEVSPSIFLGPEKVSTIDRSLLIGGCSISNPTTKDTDVLENSTGGVLFSS